MPGSLLSKDNHGLCPLSTNVLPKLAAESQRQDHTYSKIDALINYASGLQKIHVSFLKMYTIFTKT